MIAKKIGTYVSPRNLSLSQGKYIVPYGRCPSPWKTSAFFKGSTLFLREGALLLGKLGAFPKENSFFTKELFYSMKNLLGIGT